MTSALAFIFLFLLTVLWLLLPLCPALWELKRKTDVAPLRVVREHDGNIRYFARGFETYARQQLETSSANWTEQERTQSFSHDVFPDGTSFVVVRGAEFPLSGQEERENTVRKIVVAEVPLRTPPHLVFAAEVWAHDHFYSSGDTVFRALLGEKNLHLDADNTLLRWLHSSGEVTVGTSSTLYGRASSDEKITLARHCRFQRLNAPTLVFGDDDDNSAANRDAPVVELAPWQPEDAREASPRHFFVKGDCRVPANVILNGNLVATGHVLIGEGACVRGNIKSQRSITLAKNSRVEGAVVSIGALEMSEQCVAFGPLISEAETRIGSECRIGSLDKPTTISAPFIEIAQRVRCHGTVWARELGAVGIAPRALSRETRKHSQRFESQRFASQQFKKKRATEVVT